MELNTLVFKNIHLLVNNIFQLNTFKSTTILRLEFKEG